MSDKLDSGMTTLQRIIVPELVRGLNFEQVAEQNNIPVVEVVREWREYIENRSQMSPVEQYHLHLLRLENLMQLVSGYVESSSGSDSDAVKNLLGLFEQIEKLQSLNKSRLDEAASQMAILSEKQMMQILQVLHAFKEGLEQRIIQSLSYNRIKDIRQHMLDNKDEWFYDEADKALEIIRENELTDMGEKK